LIVQLNLIVIRSAIPTDLAAFYSQFGLEFDYHRHGNGPMHYSVDVDGVTLEIYPLKASQKEADLTLRLGFQVADLEAVIAKGVDVVSAPKLGQWGYRCVVTDPEGRRVELVER
jgi:lactoylglutathione lyase